MTSHGVPLLSPNMCQWRNSKTCEEGKSHQAAGARQLGQRLHWYLVCAAASAPGESLDVLAMCQDALNCPEVVICLLELKTSQR